ncbi:hypothetical protein [Capnocytophaga felis]|uniref:Uncharacterized protein n=1 Tax=Capnocytophaga felis TaxID=2267611 RepID=A0A5M4BBG9_9FLAO|nr:hypothetical protein [Capnocytophaga felis]GET46921.1 hypothetical protein RCZ01_22230 [Capnocytophaga felis]GET49441.1 hypothetical protein RCZ02_22720 [Capnocytophaga felis]
MKTEKTQKKEVPIHKMMTWCWSKGISIYPVPYVSNGSRLRICLNKKGKETIGKDIFDNGKAIYDKILEMYRFIYEKNNK